MQDIQYSTYPQRSFDNPSQTLHAPSTNLPPASAQPLYFDGTGHLQPFIPFSSSLSDSSSLPPAGFMHDDSYERSSMKLHPPALQTHNLTANSEYVNESPYSGYYNPFDSPHMQLSTPMTPSQSSFYANGSAADSMTSFSPSSNTSGEFDSSEATSPTAANAAVDDLDPNEPPAENAGNIAERAERKKRNSRRMWTHSLEKYIFTPHEIATLGTPHRRTIYSASLEAHIDRLHSQLLGIDLYPVDTRDLHLYRGLNCKIAKGMVAGLQHDFVQVRTRLLEIERATNNAREIAAVRANHERIGAQNEGQGQVHEAGQARKHSLDSSLDPSGALPPLSATFGNI